MMTDVDNEILPEIYDFLIDEYELISEEKLLTIWKKRFSSFFPNLVPNIKEYRFRVYDPKNLPKSMILLSNDGHIFEFSMTRLGSAELKTLN